MKPTHVTVCICTFRRPEMLDALLNGLWRQKTDGKFTFSVRVVDNDREQSAASLVQGWAEANRFPIEYAVEPCQNIARARNKAVTGINSEYVAMIDDDEVPCNEWLLHLVSLIETTSADGVLGPVRPSYPPGCPAWLQRSGLCDRPTHRTGQDLEYHQTRTGNALVRSALFCGEAEPFRVEFGLEGGEDIDFFKRKIGQGSQFVWCNEADAFESVPNDRWKLGYYFRRQLRLGGLLGERDKKVNQFVRSLCAAITHAIQGLLLLPLRRHRYSGPLVRFAYHFGYLRAVIGVAHTREREEMVFTARKTKVTGKCQGSDT